MIQNAYCTCVLDCASARECAGMDGSDALLMNINSPVAEICQSHTEETCLIFCWLWYTMTYLDALSKGLSEILPQRQGHDSRFRAHKKLLQDLIMRKGRTSKVTNLLSLHCGGVINEHRAIFIQQKWLSNHRADECTKTIAKVHCLWMYQGISSTIHTCDISQHWINMRQSYASISIKNIKNPCLFFKITFLQWHTSFSHIRQSKAFLVLHASSRDAD